LPPCEKILWSHNLELQLAALSYCQIEQITIIRDQVLHFACGRYRQQYVVIRVSTERETSTKSDTRHGSTVLQTVSKTLNTLCTDVEAR
jgi:hypothetical protein